MSKHTPGPWVPQQGHRTNVVRGIATKDGHCVVTFGGIAKPMSAEGQANARLIAAAPELLAACEAMLRAESFYNESHPVEGADALNEMRAAIKKAKGE